MHAFRKISWVILTTTSICACASSPHRADMEALAAVRDRTFDLGIVKVAGGLPLPMMGDEPQKKRDILGSLPIGPICDVLRSEYGIQVRTREDREIKTVTEELEDSAPGGSLIGAGSGPAPSGGGLSVTLALGVENPYWGSKHYRPLGFFESLAAFESWGAPVIAEADLGDFIYLKYAMRVAGLPWDLQEEFFYELWVQSNGKKLAQHQGMVAQGDLPKKDLLVDFDQVWADFESHASDLADVLARDIREAKPASR